MRRPAPVNPSRETCNYARNLLTNSPETYGMHVYIYICICVYICLYVWREYKIEHAVSAEPP